MERVLERADQVPEGWDQDDIHDLRVALRRCRAMAEALSGVNPDPVWRKIKKSSREVFHSLGSLRDTQVEREWLKKLWPPGHPWRRKLLRMLSQREKLQTQDAQKALANFDRRAWKKWTRKIGQKAGFFPVGSIVFQRLALSELNQCAALFDRARRRRSAAAWHRARIELKRFRYLSENFLPSRYEAWAPAVKRLQDLLGEVHDLDVLSADIRKIAAAQASAPLTAELEKLQSEKVLRLAEVAAAITGPRSVVATWRANLSLPHLITADSPAVQRLA